MRELHDLVLSTEKQLFSSSEPSYPLFTAKVSPGLGFVEDVSADVFFLHFDHIFDMYHQKRLDFSLVRLYVLHLAFLISREQISKIAVADPYYMSNNFLRDPKSRIEATVYIEEFMVANKKKEIMLVPYFTG